MDDINSKNLEFLQTRLQLPSSISRHLLEFLNVQDYMWCGAVCRNWKRVVNHYFEAIILPMLPWRSDWMSNQRPIEKETWFALMHRWGTVLFDPEQFNVMGQTRHEMVPGFAACNDQALRWSCSSNGFQVFDVNTGEVEEIRSPIPHGAQPNRNLFGTVWSEKIVVSISLTGIPFNTRALELVDPKQRTVSLHTFGNADRPFDDVMMVDSAPSKGGWVAFGECYSCQISFMNLNTSERRCEVVDLANEPIGLSREEDWMINRLAATDNAVYALVSVVFQRSKIVGVRVDHSKAEHTWGLLFNMDIEHAFNRGLTDMSQVWGNLLVKGSRLALHTHRSIRVFDSLSGDPSYSIPTQDRHQVHLLGKMMIQKWFAFDNSGHPKDGIDKTIVRSFMKGGEEIASFSLKPDHAAGFIALDGPKLALLIRSSGGSYQIKIWNISSKKELISFPIQGGAEGRRFAGLAFQRGRLFLFKRTGEFWVWHPTNI